MSRRKTLRGSGRRLAAFLAAVMLLTVFSACGAEKEGETVYVSPPVSEAPVQADKTETEARPKVTDAEQRELIARYADLWTVKDSAEPWFYAITDLDHNGRLEVIAASTQGTGLFTYANFYEVSEDYSRLVPCETSGEEWESWPDLIQESLPCYYDGASGRYAYVCEDMLRNGAAYYDQTLTAIWLENGHVQQEALANKTTVYTDANTEEPEISCQDAEGNPITQEEYDGWADRAFAGMEKSTLTLFWSEEPPQASTETDAAAPEDTESAVVITKNPRSEYIAEGGHTWFIAHAENAESIHWQVVDPDGTVYTLEEAMEKHPGLQLQELELDTIGVSDIPLSADGWGVQAVFEGPGGTAVTEPAYLYVS